MIEEPKLMRVARDRPRPSAAQIAAFQDVPTGFVVDAMFGAGAMSPRIAPLGFGRDIECVAVGPALTAENQPGDVMATLCALNFVQAGDILVSSFGGYQACAAAGDRVAGMLKNGGAVGLITDGPMRDYAGLVEVGLPCWCTGLTPGSPFTRGPGSVGLPIVLGGRAVATGDMIVADRDGVVVVPYAQIDAVIAALVEVRKSEAALDAEVQGGLVVPDGVKAMLDPAKIDDV